MPNGRHLCACGTYYNQHLNNCPKCGDPEWAADFVPFDPRDWVYDLETYPNVITASFKHMNTGHRVRFEVSPRVNQLGEFVLFLQGLAAMRCRGIGYNNEGFDYPILHFIMQHGVALTVHHIYEKAAAIIATPWENRFDSVIWAQDRFFEQIDLYKIHHFDNKNRRTSLKEIEFNMRSDSIQDLPFEPGVPLTLDQIPTLIYYNDHDTDETGKFYIETLPMIEFRESLTQEYGRDYMNHNDTKIGKDYFAQELERIIPGSCYAKDPVTGRRTKRQTIRNYINIADVIFPYINFKTPEFQRVRDWLASQTVTETKGVFNDLSATVNGFTFDFGLGGIHGSIDSHTVYSDADYVIYDWDVASYYPNLAIANRLYPAHLGVEFCDIYKNIYLERKKHKKGTMKNGAYKLALNGGGFGGSGDKYSVFYDLQYMLSITVNGQLLLCLLAEHLMAIPGLQMIQANTDGVTVRCPRVYVDHMKAVCKWWEEFTLLELESAIYNRMFIRDVNNYIAEYESGKLKRKGTYCYGDDMGWHQNQSQMVVPMAAEAALVHGQDPADFIRSHRVIHDFMLRTKVGKADHLMLDNVEQQRIARYYIATTGGSLVKVSPPVKGAKVGQWKRANGLTDQFYNGVIAELRQGDHTGAELDSTGVPWDERINTKNRSTYNERRTGISTGHKVRICNDIADADWSAINYDYYIEEARKLIDPVR